MTEQANVVFQLESREIYEIMLGAAIKLYSAQQDSSVEKSFTQPSRRAASCAIFHHFSRCMDHALSINVLSVMRGMRPVITAHNVVL